MWDGQSSLRLPKLNLETTSGYGFTEIENLRVALGWGRLRGGVGGETAVGERMFSASWKSVAL